MGTTAGRSDARELEAAVVSHLWPHSDELNWTELNERGLRIFDRGEGATIYDVYGRSYIDGLAGLFLVNVGHGRTEIAEAMAAQASQIAYTAAGNAANPASTRLAQTLAGLTPGDLNRIFFVSGGSESVESAIKIAKQYQASLGFPKRYKIIGRRGSYHGTTYGAMSLTASSNDRLFGPFMPGVSRVPSPNDYRNDFGLSGVEGDLMCARFVEQEILNQGPESVAAVIGEPISVANGTHLPSPEYWQELRRICDRYGVLLIMDEVITGFGRTGKLFAAERYDVVPDLMTMAKGLSSGYAPIGAVAVRDKIFEPFKADGNPINHLITFGGHAVAAAAAQRNIQIIQDEELVARSAEMGTYLLEGLKTLSDHPTVGDVRGGQGLLAGVELVKSKDSKESWGSGHAFIKGLAMRTQELGLVTRVWNVLHLSPPLVITKDQIDRTVAIIDQALTEAENEFAAEIG